MDSTSETFTISKKDYEMLMRYKATRARANDKAKMLRQTDEEYRKKRKEIERKSYEKRLAKMKNSENSGSD